MKKFIQFPLAVLLLCASLVASGQASTFMKKYAGTYHLLSDREERPTEFTETVVLKADGKCTRSTPAVDDAGNVTRNPVVVAGTWKANDGVIQVTFPEEGENRLTEYILLDGKFTDREGNRLEKALPPVNYMAKYAGIYNMVGEGEAPTAKSDTYVLSPGGQGTWTYFKGATPVTIKGSWKASDGVIQLNFSVGDGDKGDELLSEFRLQNGVFRAEGVVLKKKEIKKTGK